MKKNVIKVGAVVLVFFLLSAFTYRETIEKETSLNVAEKYYEATCTKNWSLKFTFTKGDRDDQKNARKRASEAAKNHESETGHSSGVLGPY